MSGLVSYTGTVWECPFDSCKWALLAEGDERYDHVGIESALEDHMRGHGVVFSWKRSVDGKGDAG